MTRNRIALLGLAFLGLAQPALSAPRTPSLPRQSAPAQTLGEAKSLKAWTELCARLPAECAVDVSEPPLVALDPARWQAVTEINTRYNLAIRGINDGEHWGVEDRWDFAEDGKGDCEDYALSKRRALVAAGFPKRALRMTVVINEMDEGHAVLTMVTDKGDLILDNRTNAILPWGRTGYRFVKRESQEHVGWVYLGPGSGPDLTAARRPR